MSFSIIWLVTATKPKSKLSVNSTKHYVIMSHSRMCHCCRSALAISSTSDSLLPPFEMVLVAPAVDIVTSSLSSSSWRILALYQTNGWYSSSSSLSGGSGLLPVRILCTLYQMRPTQIPRNTRKQSPTRTM